MLKRLVIVSSLVAAISGLSSFSALAKIEEWHDAQGATFKGEPSDAVGSVAIFRAGNSARIVPFHLLSPEECVRFYEQVKKRPARAADWKDAKADVSYDVFHFSQQVKEGKLAPADLKGRPEPEFFLVIYGSNGESKAWETVDAMLPLFPELKKAYPTEVEGIFYGLNHSAGEHANMAVAKNMPWLVAEFREEASIGRLRQLAPADNYGVVVITRDGVALFSAGSADFSKIKLPVGALSLLLDTVRPDNPKSWKDVAYYLRATQPVAYATGRSEPVLVGNPLRAEGLKQRKIYLVDATIEVAADSTVRSVTIKPDEKNLPPAMIAPLTDALQKASVFVAAVENGRFVDGVYHYRLEVAH